MRIQVFTISNISKNKKHAVLLNVFLTPFSLQLFILPEKDGLKDSLEK